jgi:uncharacterized membrane protein YfcA
LTTAVAFGGISVTPAQLAMLAVAAVLVGFAKTAIGGVASISVAVFATVLPARESTGVLLPLLMVGDVMAVASYRAHADWRILLRLFPSVGVGIVVGTVFVAWVDDDTMRRSIGAVLLVLVAGHLWTRRSTAEVTPPGEPAAAARSGGLRRHVLAAGFGLLAGFTTMVANAGGSVMALYLLSAGLTMLGVLGTGAMFFFLVNAAKVPFSVGLGLISWASLRLDALLVPAVLLGGWLGRRTIHRIDQKLFERLVLAFTVLSALNLLR